jgi:hypothetical protein
MDTKEEFCLSIQSDMIPEQDIFDTVSAPIPHGKTLHLKSIDVSCSPREADGNRNALRVDLLWREGVSGAIFDHPVDSPVWAEISESRPYELSKCLDGTEMKSDGAGCLVIRRTVEGSSGPQCTAVVVRGHYH